MRNWKRPQSEDGASLVVVLMFISVFGLILSGLLTEAGASVRYTNTVSDHEKMVYASDAGISLGIQQLRQNNELCATPVGGGPAVPDTVVNGRTVSTTCTATSGSTLGGSGFAVITTSTGASSLDLSSGQAKKIKGPVYVSGGVSWGPGLNQNNGNFYQLKPAGACPSAPTSGQLSITAPYAYYCTTLARPDPPHNPPTMPAAAPAYVDSGSCRIFYPGKYTSPPALGSATNYFVSGVYYFEFTGQLQVKQTTVYGGKPDTSETRKFTSPPACAADPGGTTGTGVEWIFGSGSWLNIDTQGQVELFKRTGETGTTTNKISLVGVPNESAWTTLGYVANTVANTSPIVDIKDGNPQDMAIHGLLYAPNQSVNLTATNTVISQTLGGIVAYSLSMKSSASASGMDISIEAGAPDPRQVLLTATAHGVGGERDSVSTAVVKVANDDARTVTVKSWRTRGPSDSL
jgi:Tfp pilus assembly protein PilX